MARDESDAFHAFLANVYPTIKAAHPSEGRRRCRLRALDAYWRDLDAHPTGQIETALTSASDPSTADVDPLDEHTEGPELGLIVRTDFTDENAWDAFVARLRAAEDELTADSAPADEGVNDGMDVDSAAAPQPPPTAAAAEDNDEDESSDDEDDGPSRIMGLLSPPQSSPLRALLSSASNLALLRLLGMSAVRTAPAPATSTKRIAQPGSRLVDRHGRQEVYAGKPLWVYDTRSNGDMSVRVVSGSVDTYGCATGDSWRARVSHVPELQLNLATGAIMRIDFGGLDRYDHVERTRNLDEAEVLTQ